MSIARENHYVPISYQKRFLLPGYSTFYYLDLFPEKKHLSDGRVIKLRDCHVQGPKKSFKLQDLYTTSFFGMLNDDVERYLFGKIDADGPKAVQAFLNNDIAAIHETFSQFFEYLDAQKIRTPKGLDWIKAKYSGLSQVQLMLEMQQIRQMHCTMWVEAVREIVSAENSDIKFLLTDNPVTIYNPDCPLDSKYCTDPPIAFIGSQTIFPMGLNHCLILTNLEYAKNPTRTDLLTNRTYARHFGQTISRIDTMIRSRKLNASEVSALNYILKARARRYIAAAKKEWLYPEANVKVNWKEIGKCLLPPKNELWHFGGELYIGYKNGATHYQDAFGRTVGDLSYLKKPPWEGKIGVNDPCICGSGKKYKKCCQNKATSDCPITTVRSIRERNLMFIEMVINILGLNKGKTWEDVRRELSDQQVKDIHKAFGCLWPPETNIIDLLPRPDKRVFRALYSGLIDPRIIHRNVTSFVLYFDEIIVMHPFMNPVKVKPEYSPVESPEKFKEETLKNVFLLLELAPFIEKGIINLVPDPCDFNHSLRTQLWGMAKARWKHNKPDPVHMEPMMDLYRDDFRRKMSAIPDDSLRRKIREFDPRLSTQQVADLVQYMKKQRLEDPLALLQQLEPGEKGAQFMISHLSPNFELGLFLAQITGSIIYTNDMLRWNEIKGSVNCGDLTKESTWKILIEYVRNLDITFEINPAKTLAMRMSGKLGNFRSILRRISSMFLEDSLRIPSKEAMQSLLKEIKKIHERSALEFDDSKATGEKHVSDLSSMTFTGKLEFLIPPNGFISNTVQRLLLSFGSIKYLKSVPMAMFINFEGKNYKIRRHNTNSLEEKG
ncbi:MAG: DUF4238 domain-containing protein [Candidatus Zapsychrus exili]|nr:DUF4238 domain-containing protein [Candidatus Zapsychrus exili]